MLDRLVLKPAVVMFDGKPGGLDTCRDPELVVDRLHVYVDGIGTQDELLGNLMAGQPLSDQAQHFSFAGGQARWPGRGGAV